MKIYKILFAVFVILGLNIFLTKLTYAHVLKHDGKIGAVLHVNPDDDPIVGVPTNFYFEFKDKDNKFKPENCECVAQIFAEGKELYKTNLFDQNINPDLTNASFSYTFPSKNIYKVTVVGNPGIEGDFQSFELNYEVRVARVSDSTNTEKSENKTNYNLIIILTTIVTMVVVYIITRKGKGVKS